MSDEQEKQPDAPAPTWPRVITLKHPIDFGKERIEQLEFRRGRSGDAKGIEFGETVSADQLALIASRLCGRPPSVIDKLDIEDTGEVMDIALDFYVAYLGGGGKRRR